MPHDKLLKGTDDTAGLNDGLPTGRLRAWGRQVDMATRLRVEDSQAVIATVVNERGVKVLERRIVGCG